MNYKSVLNELYSLDIKKWTFGLDRIESLLKKLGNPEKKLKCIHVTGTNGKGSVCAMLQSVLMNAGYNVGLYTSPHLKKFNERIRTNNNLISDEDLVKYYLKVKKHINGQSFFEITTAMTFLYFAEKNVDFAVLEAGLGGRLDATNVINPLVSIITNVGLEHTNFLGNTIGKIAYEKAGIIKENIPIITAAEGIALDTIKKIATLKSSELVIIKKNELKIKSKIKIQGKISNKDKKNKEIKNYYYFFEYRDFTGMFLENLNGKFQAFNAAIVIEALWILIKRYSIKISKKNIVEGLKNAKWPGRLQFLEKNVLVDCAHNPSGFRILAEELKNFDNANLIAVFGFSNDKDIKKISRIISPMVDKIILTKSSNERAADPEKLECYFSNKHPIIIKNPKKALGYAKKTAKKEDLILITGSIFLVGEII